MTSVLCQLDPLDTLYRNQYAQLLGWLQRRMPQHSLASELAQETFARVVSRCRAEALRLEELREPQAYLRAVARGLVIDQWRRQTVEMNYLQALHQRQPSSAPSAEEQAMQTDAIHQLEQALAGLPPLVRQTFWLSRLDGLSHAEIAARLEISVRSVERYLQQALSRCHDR